VIRHADPEWSQQLSVWKQKTCLHRQNSHCPQQKSNAIFWLQQHYSSKLGTSDASCKWWVLCKECFVECNLGKVRGWETSAPKETLVLVAKQCAAMHCTSLNFNGIPVAHSPDFSPCDFWVLPTPKHELQGQKFGCNHEVMQASTTTLDKMSRKSYYTVWVVCNAQQRMYRFFHISHSVNYNSITNNLCQQLHT
jgi:hypothetical protein